MTILERLRERLAASNDPEERIRIFVRNHVDYAVARPKAMKVLSHEDDVLKNGCGAQLTAIKRDYYRICVGLVNDLAKVEGLNDVESHVIASTGDRHPHGCDGTVRHDELAVHLVQPARRSGRRHVGARNKRCLSARYTRWMYRV